MFYNFSFFAKPSMDFIQLRRDDRACLKFYAVPTQSQCMTLRSRSQTEFFCVKSLQCQLLQSLWLIWIVFAMNGYKRLKCFRKEKRISGELPCPATGLIMVNISTCRGISLVCLWLVCTIPLLFRHDKILFIFHHTCTRLVLKITKTIYCAHSSCP